jgi:hypothetical protein
MPFCPRCSAPCSVSDSDCSQCGNSFYVTDKGRGTTTTRAGVGGRPGLTPCPDCGHTCSTAALACPSCGMPLINCPACNSPISTMAASCPKCGHPMSVTNNSSPYPRVVKQAPRVHLNQDVSTEYYLKRAGIGIVCVLAVGVVINSMQNKGARTSNPGTQGQATPGNNATPSTSAPPPTPAEALAKAKSLFESNKYEGDLEKASDQLKSIPATAPEYKQAQALLKKVDGKIKEEAALKAEIGGSPPTKSPWDGSVYAVDRYLKQVLRDPDSLSYERWSDVYITRYGGKRYYAVDVTYRAKNGFGGMNLSQSTFLIRNNQVVQMIDGN